MGARGVIGLALLVGGGALAVAVGAGFNPLQAIQSWAGSVGVGSSAPANSRSSDTSSTARTSGGKAG